MINLPIHIALCVNDGYVHYICVTIKSIIQNNLNESITIHLLTDQLSTENKKLLQEVVKEYKSVSLNIHIVDDKSLQGLKDTWSIYTWYRVLLPQVLSNDIHRVLYLDADTIVTGNIKELFQMNMNNKAIAGSIDPESFNPETFIRCGYIPSLQYICAGVMLMNLDYWREHNLTEKVISWGRENNDRIKFPDQDTINYLCRNNKIVLPLKYGIIGGYFTLDNYYQQPYQSELIECINNPVIIHYAGQAPWIKELSNHLFQHKWMEYNQMLSSPVKRKYKTKGWNLIKMHIWNFLHPFRNSNKLSIEDVKKILLMR